MVCFAHTNKYLNIYITFSKDYFANLKIMSEKNINKKLWLTAETYSQIHVA